MTPPTADQPKHDSVLVVVAHPDDEVLGCGATGAALAANGVTVRACILAAKAEARGLRPSTADLQTDTMAAQRLLGFGAPILGAFPNIALNTVAHLELVQFIERAIVETGATTIFTHHPRDLNHDHFQVSLACQAAAHLWRRRSGVPRLSQLLLMETLSSTDWSMKDGRDAFEPDVFVPADDRFVQSKLEALAAYRGVMRDPPHSRSAEVVRALATLRGAQCGHFAAEAFQTAYRVLPPDVRSI